MPTARRSRTIGAPIDEVFATVADPYHLPRWWPRVVRVEDVGRGGFTQVLRSDKGRDVRADFRVLERRSPRVVRWSQDVEGTPFEPLLAASVTTIELSDEGSGTRVELRLDQRLRGVARFGGFLVRRANQRTLREALSALEEIHARP